MKKSVITLLFALVLSGAWLAIGTSFLSAESSGKVASFVEERADICETPGLTEADRTACEASPQRSNGNLLDLQEEVRQDSMMVAIAILLLVWSSAAALGLLASAILSLADRNPLVEIDGSMSSPRAVAMSRAT